MIKAAIMVLLQVSLGLARPPALDIDGQARVEVNALNGRLLASSSATQTLRLWCADHRLAAKVLAR